MGDTRKTRDWATASVAAPSSSIVVVSPRNEVLLLQRVQRGTFPAAHVFPGGNVSSFHEEGLVPAVDSATRHVDGPAYQLAAIRETFEESGVLLARDVRGRTNGTNELLSVPEEVARAGRRRVERKEVRFIDWLASVGGEADQQGLIPFTRWVTPPNMARRFTTQMYLYLMPLSVDLSRAAAATADQTEVATAEFATAATWVERARRNEIVLFPPQMYILGLLAPLLAGWQGEDSCVSSGAARTHLAAERERLMAMVRAGSGSTPGGSPWADLVISPRMMAQLPDGRVVMRLDQPGPELRGSGRTGDLERVVLVGNMPPGPPRDVELCLRSEVMPAIRAQASGTKL